METEVVTALIAAFVALVASLLTVYQQRQLTRHQRELSERQQQSAAKLALQQSESTREVERLRDQLESHRDQQKRELDALEQLNLHREPLLEASEDLFHRIRNIRERGFLAYLQSPDEHRKEMATLGTLYRFGKYWGTVNTLYGTVTLLQLESNHSTKDVAELLTRIGSVQASDDPDHAGRTLMFWREEQRAVAELMQRGTQIGRNVIGFATFAERYPTEFAPWLASFEKDLMRPEPGSTVRMG